LLLLFVRRLQDKPDNEYSSDQQGSKRKPLLGFADAAACRCWGHIECHRRCPFKTGLI
jgi:hypothetical protein